MARIDAGGNRHNSAETVEHFGHLFEAASERKLGSRRVLDRIVNPPFARSSPWVAAAIAADVRSNPCSRSAPRNDPGCKTRYSADKPKARSTSPRNASTDFFKKRSLVLARFTR